MISSEMRVIIVGAGIVGLSHAYLLQKLGHQVTLLDGTAAPQGATVRNFGMIWPVGQRPGRMRNLALRSRDIWSEVAEQAGFWINPCGSLHLAYHPLEIEVLKEFADLAWKDEENRGSLIGPKEALQYSSLIRPESSSGELKGAWYSQTEACVDPREVANRLSRYLECNGADLRWSTQVTQIEPGRVVTSSGEILEGDWVVSALGPSMHQLHPALYSSLELNQTRLQMMRFAPVSGQERLGVHLCSGLTLAHYPNFAECRTLSKLKAFQAATWPRQVDNGIHILVSEHADGTLTVGDSHEYGLNLMPYRSEEIDRLIMESWNEFFLTDRYKLLERWEGSYNTHPTLPYVLEHPEAGLTIANTFGTGMTLSFGLAELSLRTILS